MYELLLPLIVFSPIIGSLLVYFKKLKENKPFALCLSLIHMAAIAALTWQYNLIEAGVQFSSHYFGGMTLGVDSLSLLLLMLNNLLFFLVFISFNRKVDPNYISLFLLLQGLVNGVFIAQNIIYFFIFFEAILIPMLMIIGIYGGERRTYSSLKFFLYTFAGSIFMLGAIIGILAISNQVNFNEIYQFKFNFEHQIVLWILLFIAFAVKMPMIPVHTWLPDAHVEAPTAGSVILAGILLKIAGYGFIKFSLLMLPEASQYFMPLVMVLSLIGIVYGSLVAYSQTDVKKMVAYSSVAHMGFVTLGLFCGNKEGVEGAIFQMHAHGLVSALAFFGIGIIYDRVHTRAFADLGGVKSIMPRYALTFLVAVMGMVSLPGTVGFVGEFLCLVGALKINVIIAVIASSSMVLSAAYGLSLYKQVFLGNLGAKVPKKLPDITFNEGIYIYSLGILVVIFGVYPEIVIKYIRPTSEMILTKIGG